MNGSDPSVERAFVATLYLCGERGSALEAYELGPDARALVALLGHPDQHARALTLAREVAKISLALERGDLT
jgi:hypothetical protein